jgi:CheY-like chemotaxis protein
MEKMNSSMNYQLPAKKQTLPKALGNKEISRTRPPPNFLRVLVVDDKKSRGIANADMISGFGHAVELARDGITAMRMAAANRPDAVLLNTNLGSLDEGDVARYMRADFPEQPPLIIGLASHANRLVRRQCVKAGMDLVLEAPLNAEAIETVLLFECAKLTVDMNSDSSKRPRSGRCVFQLNPLLLPQAIPSVYVNYC